MTTSAPDPLEYIKLRALQLNQRLSDIRAARLPANGMPWYPYDIFGSIWNLSSVLTGENRNIFDNLEGKSIADIGSADGDFGLLLSSLGASVDIIDYEGTNMNRLSGARTLARELGSDAKVISCNIDQQFTLPRRYDLVIFLGILYHLKNPFYALEHLASRVDRMVLSTRISEYTAPVQDNSREKLAGTAALLVGADQLNNDVTNYWIFNDASLRLILRRSGWSIVDYKIIGGGLETSDPFSADGDRRAFCYLESRSNKT